MPHPDLAHGAHAPGCLPTDALPTTSLTHHPPRNPALVLYSAPAGDPLSMDPPVASTSHVAHAYTQHCLLYAPCTHRTPRRRPAPPAGLRGPSYCIPCSLLPCASSTARTAALLSSACPRPLDPPSVEKMPVQNCQCCPAPSPFCFLGLIPHLCFPPNRHPIQCTRTVSLPAWRAFGGSAKYCRPPLLSPLSCLTATLCCCTAATPSLGRGPASLAHAEKQRCPQTVHCTFIPGQHCSSGMRAAHLAGATVHILCVHI